MPYPLIQCLVVPVLTLRALWLRARGQMTGADLRESLTGPRHKGPAIWVHGASIGELASARPIITALAQDHPLLVTTTRTTAKAAVRGWGLPGVTPSLAPLDLGWVARVMIRRGPIRMLVIIENELWPARLLAAHDLGVPVILLSARMSQSSAGVWARVPGLSRAVLGPVAQAFPQDAGTVRRLEALGVAPDRIAPVVKLKASYQPPPPEHPEGFDSWTRGHTLLAAATHPGEDQIVLEAFSAARARVPDLRLIIAPRHATRSAALAALIRAAGYSDYRRSRGDAPDGPVYLADTMGEMALWYDLAGLCFVGGSLVRKGGHTPYEPAAHGCALLHGPHLTNFAEDYARFDAANAARQVEDATTLTDAILTHLGDTAMARRARDVPQPVDIPAITRAITDLLPRESVSGKT